MKLFTSPAMPFGRKVLVVAIETGQDARLQISSQPVSPVAPNAAVMAANPLGKIPCLVTDDGSAVYDSRVIAEHLDGLHDGPRLFPEKGPARVAALTAMALADGILDAGILVRYESIMRPEALRWPDWIAGQKAKMTRGLDRLEVACAAWDEGFDIGQIATACAVGWLDFRFADDRWRDGRPRLAAWHARVAGRPSLAATMPAA